MRVKDGALGSLIKQLTEAALTAEIDSHLTQEFNRNRKNGYATKTMKSKHGEFQVDGKKDILSLCLKRHILKVLATSLN